MKQQITITTTKDIEICDFCKEKEVEHWGNRYCAICGKFACHSCREEIIGFNDESEYITYDDGGREPLTSHHTQFCKSCAEKNPDLIRLHKRLAAKIKAIDKLINDAEELGGECDREFRMAKKGD